MERLIKKFDEFFELYKEFKVKYSKCVGLTPAECNFIGLVPKNGISMKELSKKLHLSPSRTTRIADSLEKKDLIKRKSNIEDRRSFFVFLTEKGMDIYSKENKMCANFDITFRKYFNEKEEEMFLKYVERFIKVIKVK